MFLKPRVDQSSNLKIVTTRSEPTEKKPNESGNMNRMIMIPLTFIFVGRCIAQEGGAEIPTTSFFSGPVRISFGGSVGHAFVKMKDVNDDLKATELLFKTFNTQAPAAEALNGGLYFDGTIAARLNRFLIGVSVSSVSSSGTIGFGDGTASLSETYDASTLEIMPLVGVRFPVKGITVIDLVGGGGYGKATVDYNGKFVDNFNPRNNITVQHPVEGNYFAGRLEGIFRILVTPLNINFSVGYRFSDAGTLKGRQSFNGEISQGEYAIKNSKQADIGFDFTGFVLRGGLSIEF
jgi:hypothetical protein